MKQKPYRYPLYLGLRVLQTLVSSLPRNVALFLGDWVGRLAFMAAGRERRKTLLHLTWAYGSEKSPREIRGLAQGVFIHLGQVAADVLRFPKLTREELEHLVDKGEGLAIFDRVLSKGRGAILLTAHFGNWELLGAFFRLYGYEGALVGRKIYYDKFNEVLLDLRSKVTLRTIYQDAPAKESLKVLQQNGILGILADQDVDRFDGIFVPFFGRPAYTLTAPVKMALATGAPIVPAFLVEEGKRYRFLVDEPIEVEMKGSREETIQEYTSRWSRVVEEKIRTYPDQWVWMHRRWKTVSPSAGRTKETVSSGVSS